MTTTEPLGACSLECGARGKRLAEWKTVLAEATGTDHTQAARIYRFAGDVTTAGRLAGLAVAETGCCTFFRFALTADNTGVRFVVTAPPANAADLEAVFPSGNAGGSGA